MSIVFDATSNGGSQGASPFSWSHTVGSGANRILFVTVYVPAVTDFVTGVTFNGVALTKIAFSHGGDRGVGLWYLVNPATGTHSITVTSGQPTTGQGASYFGASQTGVPDASNTGAVNNSGSLSVAVTSTVDNCWLVGAGSADVNSFTAGSNTTLRNSVNFHCALFDSNAAQTPAGSHSLAFSAGSSADKSLIVASFAPVPPPLPTLTTDAATDIAATTATLNGEITDVGSGDADERGFVWGTTSLGYPGNVAPGSSGYDDDEIESGTFSTGSFDYAVTGLTASTTYYCRAWAHNSDGYAYGGQVSFTTLNPYRAGWTNLPGTSFVAGDTTTIFAEQLNDILDRLHALDGG